MLTQCRQVEYGRPAFECVALNAEPEISGQKAEQCVLPLLVAVDVYAGYAGCLVLYSLYEQTRQIAANVYFPRFVQHLHAGLFAVLYRFEFPCESLRDVDSNRHALGGFAAGRCEAEGRGVSAFKGYFAVRLLAVDRYYGLFERVVILVSRAEYLYAFPVGGLQCAAGHHFVFPNVTK